MHVLTRRRYGYWNSYAVLTMLDLFNGGGQGVCVCVCTYRLLELLRCVYVVACGCIGCLVYWYQPSGRQRALESLPGQDPYPLGLGATGPTPGTNGWGHCMGRQEKGCV